MSHTQIQARIAEVQAQLVKLGYPAFPVTFEVTRLKAGVSGTAYRNKPHMEFSQDYLREHFDQIIGRTVPHEVAHLYVHRYHPQAKQSHGPEFRRIMTLLGCDTSTYHSMKLVDGPKRQQRTKTRFVYMTDSGLKGYLTRQQHEKVMTGRARFSLKGEPLLFTGYTELFK